MRVIVLNDVGRTNHPTRETAANEPSTDFSAKSSRSRLDAHHLGITGGKSSKISGKPHKLLNYPDPSENYPPVLFIGGLYGEQRCSGTIIGLGINIIQQNRFLGRDVGGQFRCARRVLRRRVVNLFVAATRAAESWRSGIRIRTAAGSSTRSSSACGQSRCCWAGARRQGSPAHRRGPPPPLATTGGPVNLGASANGNSCGTS